MDMQVFVFEIERNRQTFTLNRGEQRRVHIEIDRVAKLVRLARRFGFHTGGQVRRIVTPHRTLAQTSQQVAQSFVTQKIETFLSNFEFDIARERLFDSVLAIAALHVALLLGLFFMKREVTLFNQSLDQLVQHLLELRPLVLPFILIEHLLNLMLTQKPLVHQRLQ